MFSKTVLFKGALGCMRVMDVNPRPHSLLPPPHTNPPHFFEEEIFYPPSNPIWMPCDSPQIWRTSEAKQRGAPSTCGRDKEWCCCVDHRSTLEVSAVPHLAAPRHLGPWLLLDGRSQGTNSDSFALQNIRHASGPGTRYEDGQSPLKTSQFRC